MTEYIKREDAIRTVMTWGDKPYLSYDAILRDIMNIPVADVIDKDDMLKVLAEIDGNFKLKEDNNG